MSPARSAHVRGCQATGCAALWLPGLAVAGMGILLVYGTAGSAASCAHGPGGTRCVVSRRLFGFLNVPVRRVSDVQGVKVEQVRVTRGMDHASRTHTSIAHPYLVTPRGLVSLMPPLVQGVDSEVTVGLVEAFCKDKSAPPLSVELQAGTGLALQVLGALMMFWGASLVIEALRSVITGTPPKW